MHSLARIITDRNARCLGLTPEPPLHTDQCFSNATPQHTNTAANQRRRSTFSCNTHLAATALLRKVSEPAAGAIKEFRGQDGPEFRGQTRFRGQTDLALSETTVHEPPATAAPSAHDAPS